MVSSKYKNPSRLWLGPDLYVIIHDADSAEMIFKLRYCNDRPDIYDLFLDLGGDGLFTLQSKPIKQQ